MELNDFYTLVKEGHKFDEPYIRGRISGIAHALCHNCDKTLSRCWREGDGIPGKVAVVRCTQDVYDRFAQVIEELYPGLCEFNYEMK